MISGVFYHNNNATHAGRGGDTYYHRCCAPTTYETDNRKEYISDRIILRKESQ
jgi:hypothetical protein